MQTPDALRRRAQFQLWIFSYTVLARPSKNRLSRVMIGRGATASNVHHARRRVRSASLSA
jgi:hypothetical protein